MPWVKLDDGFPDHRKLAELGDYAPLCGWLFVCGLAFCNRQLTDGLIPKRHIARLASFRHISIATGGSEGLFRVAEEIDPEVLAEGLISVGLWEDAGSYYQVHDYLDYNPSKAEVIALRAARSDAGRVGGQHSWQTRPRLPKDTTSATAQAKRQQPLKQNVSNRSSKIEAKHHPVPVPVPTYVDPVLTDLDLLDPAVVGEGGMGGNEAAAAAAAASPTTAPPTPTPTIGKTDDAIIFADVARRLPRGKAARAMAVQLEVQLRQTYGDEWVDAAGENAIRLGKLDARGSPIIGYVDGTCRGWVDDGFQPPGDKPWEQRGRQAIPGGHSSHESDQRHTDRRLAGASPGRPRDRRVSEYANVPVTRIDTTPR